MRTPAVSVLIFAATFAAAQQSHSAPHFQQYEDEDHSASVSGFAPIPTDAYPWGPTTCPGPVTVTCTEVVEVDRTKTVTKTDKETDIETVTYTTTVEQDKTKTDTETVTRTETVEVDRMKTARDYITKTQVQTYVSTVYANHTRKITLTVSACSSTPVGPIHNMTTTTHPPRPPTSTPCGCHNITIPWSDSYIVTRTAPISHTCNTTMSYSYTLKPSASYTLSTTANAVPFARTTSKTASTAAASAFTGAGMRLDAGLGSGVIAVAGMAILML